MCEACWRAYGEPKMYNQRVRALVRTAERVLQRSSVGGHLHIVLDDWNLDDEHLLFLQTDWAHLTGPEKMCLQTFIVATLEERASALAILQQIWRPDATL